MAVFAWLPFAGGGAAMAQVRQGYASFVTPFPEGDVYKTLIIGDWLAHGLLGGLSEVFEDDRRLQIRPEHFEFRGLLRGEWEGQFADLALELSRTKYNIAVVQLGTFDRVSIKSANGRFVAGSDQWNEIFGDRVERIMKALRQANVSVYWVGLPIMRGEHRNDDVRAINEVFRQRAIRNGVKYIDIYKATASDDGEYSSYGPDVTGAERLLRFKDGIHFTKSGYAKIAHFIERQIARDLSEARSERDVPLAGGPVEQKRIARGSVATEAATGGGVPSKRGAGGGEPADDVELAISERGAGGRMQKATIEILRPAIASSVIDVLTRGQTAERAAKIGLTISDELPNGLLVLRSITPAATTRESGNRLPASELPFFRVLVKGERLQPVAGRADDFRWPRDDAPPALPLQPVRVAAGSVRRQEAKVSWDPRLPPLPPRRPMRLNSDEAFSPKLE